MTQLLPCPSCSRHVRRTESGCPFCGAALSLENEPSRVMPSQRLGRAATFAFGAAMASSVAGCGTATTGTDAGIAPAYGAPVDSSMLVDAGNDAAVLAMYGGPPGDAGTDTGGPAPAYGGPIFDDTGLSDVDAGGSSSDYGAPPAP